MKKYFIALVVIVLVGGLGVFFWLDAPKKKQAADQANSSSLAFVWNFTNVGTDPNTSAPTNKVTLNAGGKEYDAGSYEGSCFVVEASAWQLLPKEKSGVICWFAGGGKEAGVFEEDGKFLLKVGELDEGSEEIPGVRGNFKVINEIK